MEDSSRILMMRNQRGGVRLPVPDRQQAVVLEHGGVSLKADCVDQSATGFGLRYDQQFPWAAGQKLRMNKEGTWYEVQVRYVRPEDGSQRIGLQWLRDCDDEPVPSGLSLMWQVLGQVLGFGWIRNLQLLGICSAFLLSTVTFVILLRPELLSLQVDRLLGSNEGDSFHRAVRSERSVSPAPRGSAESASLIGAEGGLSAQRLQGPLAATEIANWADLEQLLGLSADQSRALLSLLWGAVPSHENERLDGDEVVIDNHRELAACLRNLPDTSLGFLRDEQRQQLRGLAQLLSQYDARGTRATRSAN